jgi:hypothetical protein
MTFGADVHSTAPSALRSRPAATPPALERVFGGPRKSQSKVRNGLRATPGKKQVGNSTLEGKEETGHEQIIHI